MRRLALVAVATVAIGSLAAPGVSMAQSPAHDSVLGSVDTGEGRSAVRFTFDVRSGPSGESPTGSVRFDALLIDLGELPVSCLTVSGNRASMIVLISAPPPAPTGILISVEDNHGTAEDGLVWQFLTTLPTECPAPSEVGGPLLAGDIIVTDAQPFPTSEAQCKDGGWHAFGIFKDQDDCVAFVRRQARQECIFIRGAHGRPAFHAWYGTGVDKRHAMRNCIRQRGGD